MATAPLFRESLLAARQRLVAGREKIKQQHCSGTPGIQICAWLTELLDSIVLELYEAALVDLGSDMAEAVRAQVALVAHAGYGRRDVAPYSDVDLMILHAPGSEATVEPLAKRLMRDLFDVGLDLGQSVRTISQACQLAAKDATICTSLIESRFLTGSEKLYSQFTERFERRMRARWPSLLVAIEKSRREEYAQFGETIYLLEPNVKRSRGALRDIQLLRWIGFIRYGTSSIDALQLQGRISKDDQRTIRRATEYLLRLRNELHFQAGKSQDVLRRSEQVRLAEWYKFENTEALLAVEQFMREYFRQTTAARSVVASFVANARPISRWGQWVGTLLSHQVEGDYRITPRHIVATKRGLAKLRTDLNEVLRLTDLANLYNKRIANSTWEAVRAAVPNLSGDVSQETSRRFLSLLSQPARLGELLHRLHDLGVLEKIIPEYTHARCLLQFNEYHKYTVDEHCIRAVDRATSFLADPGPLGRLYQGLKQKRTLHLALLIHDLGKGFVEDHSEVGLRIAEATAQRLRLPLLETETLKFLVHKHLLMSHLAFRRDTSDDELIVRFAVEVGSPERLAMLTILTAADFSSVGPGVWNAWKAEVLISLYQRAMEHLASEGPVIDSADRLQQRRQQVLDSRPSQVDRFWFEQQVAALPTAYLMSSSLEKLAEELHVLHDLPPGEVRAWGRFMSDSRTVEFTVGTHEQITPGVFHKLTGALASQGLQILSAEINTLARGLVLDRFYVLDPDYTGRPPANRLEEVNRALTDSLRTSSGNAPAFRKVWRNKTNNGNVSVAKLPTRVRIDNSTSDRFTILDIFAADRMGLLFTIARTLFQLELSVSLAKIGTYLDQVVDVFYVTDQAGNKISDENRLQTISNELLAAIEALQND